MSLLTPLLPSRRRTIEPPADVPAAPQVWHVGLSRDGMFPHHEASCPCVKAPCGLAIPRPDVFCTVHQGQVEYRQLHVASECAFPRKHWFPRPHRGSRARRRRLPLDRA
jgi:hypothetical protein